MSDNVPGCLLGHTVDRCDHVHGELQVVGIVQLRRDPSASEPREKVRKRNLKSGPLQIRRVDLDIDENGFLVGNPAEFQSLSVKQARRGR